MNFLIKRRYLALFFFVGLIFSSLVILVKFNKVNLFPSDQVEAYIGRVMLPQGTEIKTTKKALSEISKTLKTDFPDNINYAVAKAGRDAVGPNDPKEKLGENVGQIMVWVNEYTKNEVAADKMLSQLNAVALPDGFGEISLSFEAMENGPPVGSPVEGVFRSGNDESLAAVIDGVMEKLKATEGIKDVQVNDVTGESGVKVEIDYELANQLGLISCRSGPLSGLLFQARWLVTSH